MKKIATIFLILGLLLTSCVEDSISKQEKRAARQRAKEKKEQVETPAEVELGGEITPENGLTLTEERVVHVTYTTVPTDSSYWYVIMKDEVTNWHGTVSLATPYFDFKAAKQQFETAKGKCYFKFIIQINKESLENWNTYND